MYYEMLRCLIMKNAFQQCLNDFNFIITRMLFSIFMFYPYIFSKAIEFI